MIQFIKYFCLILLAQWAGHTIASPNRDASDINNERIVGQASNIITSTILKANIDSNKNYAFSPFGYSTLLSILAEGAKDDARRDIGLLLKHPEGTQSVRAAYKSVLKSLQNDSPLLAPQFKTWLYVYRNNTIEDDFKAVLSTDYYVEVKDIDRTTGPDQESDPVSDGVDRVPSLGSLDEVSTDRVDTVTVTLPIAGGSGAPNNSKDIPDFETLKHHNSIDETRKESQKDASKFDEVVEDRQYVEVPVIKKELAKEQSAQSAATPEEQVAPVQAAAAKNEESTGEVVAKVTEILAKQPEKISLPLKQFEDLEIMHADESRYLGKAFGGAHPGDGTSVISGNSIVGDKENAASDDPSKYESKMILFNGLYFRGMWAIPFQQLRHSPENVFYTSASEKVTVKMMRSRGSYRTAELRSVNAQAIELPYENERYSLLLIVPDSRDGIKPLINGFDANCLADITAKLKEESIDVSLPRFHIDTTSGAEKSLAKAGLASIFTTKADFSGITKQQKLHIEELQQHVSFRVDEGSSSENFLTATNALRSNLQAERSLVIDRPFLFFVRDVVDNVVIVAGKITSLPEYDESELVQEQEE